jgi:hypothetical protein
VSVSALSNASAGSVKNIFIMSSLGVLLEMSLRIMVFCSGLIRSFMPSSVNIIPCIKSKV